MLNLEYEQYIPSSSQLLNELLNIEKRILIFDVTGKLINVIKLNDQKRITWDGRNQYGNVLSSGTYFYKLVAENIVYK